MTLLRHISQLTVSRTDSPRPARLRQTVHARTTCQPCLSASQHRLCTRAAPDVPQQTGGPDEEFVGIPPEDDAEVRGLNRRIKGRLVKGLAVPGTYLDALNPNTKLGKAVRAAVDELNHLNAMEMETLQQCDALLKKLGLKSSIMQAPTPPAPQEVVSSEDS